MWAAKPVKQQADHARGALLRRVRTHLRARPPRRPRPPTPRAPPPSAPCAGCRNPRSPASRRLPQPAQSRLPPSAACFWAPGALGEHAPPVSRRRRARARGRGKPENPMRRRLPPSRAPARPSPAAPTITDSTAHWCLVSTFFFQKHEAIVISFSS